MFNIVGQQIAQHSDHQDRSAHVLNPDVGDQSGSLPEQHSPQVMSPTSSHLKATHNSFLLRTTRMKIEWQVKILSSDERLLLWWLKIMFFRRHGEIQTLFNEQFKEKECVEKFQYHRKISVRSSKPRSSTHGLLE